jgi:hypothetical protein
MTIIPEEGGEREKGRRNKKSPVDSRVKLIRTLEDELLKPRFKRQYDWLQILGIKFHLRQLNIHGPRICSDWPNFTGIIDPDFKGQHLTPVGVDQWFSGNDKYLVYGKFNPDA